MTVETRDPFQMASEAFFAFILVPLILIAIALFAYRTLYALVMRQRQKIRRESCAPCDVNGTVLGPPLSCVPVRPQSLAPSSLPYSPQSLFAAPTLNIPSPPPYPETVVPLPSPPVTPAMAMSDIPAPNFPAPAYSDTMETVDLRDDPPPAYEEIAEKIAEKMEKGKK